MDKDRQDVVRRLFVAATEVLEDHHIIAIDGQRQHASMGDYRRAAEHLHAAAGQLATLANAITILLDLEADQLPGE